MTTTTHRIATHKAATFVTTTNGEKVLDDGKLIACAGGTCGYHARVEDMTADTDGNLYCVNCTADFLQECCNCGEYHVIEDTNEFKGDYYCELCFEDLTCVCESCEERFLNDELTFFTSGRDTEGMYCESCIDEIAPRCDSCDERVHRDYGYTTAQDEYICQDCYGDSYNVCDDCGEIYHSDNMLSTTRGTYCEDCYTENGHGGGNTIRAYGDNPALEFHNTDNDSNNPVYMGVELEIDGGGEDHKNAERIQNCFPENHVYFNSDGSLNNGFEIISHPFTYDYYRNNGLIDMYADAMQEAKEMNYRSHDTTTCGLHIHVGRAGLGITQEEQDATLGKLWYMTQKFWPELVTFSRRTSESLDRWAAALRVDDADLENDSAETIGKKVKERGAVDGRYRAINVTNSATIEFRMFRGTLKNHTFTATIELVHALVTLAKSLSMDILKTLSFKDFINTACIRNKYKELGTYSYTRILKEVA